VAVSAADAATALPKAQRLGMNGFIAKPVDVALLPQQIAAVIAGHPVWYSGARVERLSQA
jgi:DNA-binding NarL/FixJ family response regulator